MPTNAPYSKHVTLRPSPHSSCAKASDTTWEGLLTGGFGEEESSGWWKGHWKEGG